MPSNVNKPYEISRANGGQLPCRYGIDLLWENGDTLDSDNPPVITTNVDGLDADDGSVTISDGEETIGDIKYAAGQAILFVLVAEDDATLGDGLVFIEFTSEAGVHLTHKKAVQVFEHLPSR